MNTNQKPKGSRGERERGRISPFPTFPLSPLLLLLCTLAAAPLQAATEYQARVTITAVPAGLPTNITVNIGTATTRYWTNNANPAPATSIQTTNTIAASVTNAVLHFQNSPIYTVGVGSPEAIVDYDTNSPTTTFTITAPLNTNITVTLVGTWATVTYHTNFYSDAGPITWPTNAASPFPRTNAANALVNYLAAIETTNVIPLAMKFLRNYVDTNTAQTVANKLIVNPVITGGRHTGLTNATGTNVLFTNVTLHIAQITGAQLSGIIGAITNGYAINLVLDAPHITNATFYGTTEYNGASIDLAGSGVDNFISLTATSTIAAVGPILIFIREDGIANAVDANDVLGNIVFAGYGDTGTTVGARIRAYAEETFTDSSGAASLRFETTPTGASATVVRLRIYPDGTVQIVGTNWVNQSIITNLVAGAATIRSGSVSNVVYDTFAGTNLVARNSGFTGTNSFNSRLDLVPRSNTSLVNGYNSGVLLGSNVYIRCSGPSAAYTNAGFAAAVDGTYHILQFDNPVNNMTILNDSGLDATAANRILTTTGGLVNYTNNPVLIPAIYDGAVSRWRLIRALP